MQRPIFAKKVEEAFKTHPIVAILGPRQCGKTTLSHLYVDKKKLKGKAHFFDLEDPADLMEMAYELLNLDSLDVIYPGTKEYKLTPNITVKSL